MRYTLKETEGTPLAVFVDKKRIGHIAQHNDEPYLSIDYGIEGIPIEGLKQLEGLLGFIIKR